MYTVLVLHLPSAICCLPILYGIDSNSSVTHPPPAIRVHPASTVFVAHVGLVAFNYNIYKGKKKFNKIKIGSGVYFLVVAFSTRVMFNLPYYNWHLTSCIHYTRSSSAIFLLHRSRFLIQHHLISRTTSFFPPALLFLFLSYLPPSPTFHASKLIRRLSQVLSPLPETMK